MDLQFVVYQIFSSIGVEGYGKRRETTITGIISACYIVLVVYKLSKCHWSGRLTLDHKRARGVAANAKSSGARRDSDSSPGQTESQVDASSQLASTCDSVWPGLACTCVDLR